MRRMLIAVLAVLALSACNGKGGSVTGSSDTSASTAILSGYDGAPVAAEVSGSGDLMSISAPGFLTLDTVDRRRPIYLFPNNATLTLSDTFQFVYGGNEFNPLRRVGDSTTSIGVVLHGVLGNNARVLDAAREGIARDNELLAEAGVPVRFVLGGTGQITADWYLDPADPVFAGGRSAAGTYNTSRRDIHVGSRIVVWNLEYAQMAIVFQHELIHVLGLGHSVHAGPMMISPNGELYGHQEFTSLDADYVRLLFYRQPGTRLSYTGARENDRGAVTASRAGVTEELKEEFIVCRF
jgi:hypothetical protein